MSDCEVIVVGAGPVGLSLAGFLAAGGVSCIVLESRSQPDTDLRASTFHPPTLDMLAPIGVTRHLVQQGLVTPTWQMRRHATGQFVRFDLGAIADATKHPYRLQCEQHKLCEILTDQLEGAGNARIMMARRVVGFDQTDSGVSVTCEQDSGQRQTFTGQWLVGADGAGSFVRRELDLDFEGETYPQSSVLATTPFAFHDHLPDLDNVNYCWGVDAPFSLLRLPGRWRASLYPKPGDDLEDVLRADRLGQYLAEICPHEDIPVEDARAYRVHQRVASSYRHGRAFLVGDAAHLNVPSGGMGMNGGIHDAHNLSGRLVAVQQGADESLLDGYERQRRWLAKEAILPMAADNRERMTVIDEAAQTEKLRHYTALTQDSERLREYLLRSSMITSLQQAAERG